MDMMKQLIGGNRYGAGVKSARSHQGLTVAFRLRTSAAFEPGAVGALIDLAPSSAPWRHPVH